MEVPAIVRNGFSRLLRFFWLALLLSTLCAPATAKDHLIRSNAELTKALLEVSTTSAGDTPQEQVLRLAPGRYAPVMLRGITGPLRLVAADPANPPELSGLSLRDSADIRFENLVIRYRPARGEPVWTAVAQIVASRDIAFEKVLFEGAPARGLGPAQDGFPAGVGLRATGVDGLSIQASELRGFYIGAQVTKSRRYVLSGTELHGMRKDGINLAQVEDVLIEHNHFHDFFRSLATGDHADMIQMWTTRTDRPSVNIVIRDNILNSGHGSWTQSIFIRNELVDQGRAGPEMLYRNIRIERNVIVNAHLHGIAVGESDGVIIRNNTLVRNRRSEGDLGSDEGLASPRIRVAPQSRNVSVERNVAFAFPEPAGPGWTVRDNFLVQAERRLKPGFYDKVFVDALSGDPRNLRNFRYRQDGPLAGRGIGAPLLSVGE